jgi:hypothetical protein
MLTEGEILFEEFCRLKTISFTRIPEGASKTPDYEIVLSARTVAVEIKQLEPNAEDLAFFDDLRTKGSAGGVVDMGRARLAILDAMKQLRPYSKGRMPAMVVLYDTMGAGRGYLDPYSLSYCLYGPEKVHYAVPSDPSVDTIDLGMSRGGRSVATARHNTTLSALGVLRRFGVGTSSDLEVFHNLHAAIPLDTALWAHHKVRQFRFDVKTPGEMPEWIDCNS